MGMDLVPIKGEGELSYNWTGWSGVAELLQRNHIRVRLPGSNDGDKISANDCKLIGSVIEKEAVWYNANYGGGSYGEAPAAEHAQFFRQSGGVRCY